MNKLLIWMHAYEVHARGMARRWLALGAALLVAWVGLKFAWPAMSEALGDWPLIGCWLAITAANRQIGLRTGARAMWSQVHAAYDRDELCGEHRTKMEA